MNKTLEIIDTGQKRKFCDVHRTDRFPWCFTFVYYKGGAVIVKGWSNVVVDYIEKHFPRSLCNYTYWKNGKCASRWRFSCRIYIRNKVDAPNKNPKKKYIKIFTTSNNTQRALFLRRMPKKWIPEFDELLGTDSKIVTLKDLPYRDW